MKLLLRYLVSGKKGKYLIPLLNVVKSVTLVPQMNGVFKEEAEKNAMALLDYFDISDKAHSMSSQLSVVKMLKKIAIDQDVVIIMVTHDEAMILLCDRILKIEDKKVVPEVVPENTKMI